MKELTLKKQGIQLAKKYLNLKKKSGVNLFKMDLNLTIKDLKIIRKTKKVKQFKNQKEFIAICKEINEFKKELNSLRALKYQQRKITFIPNLKIRLTRVKLNKKIIKTIEIKTRIKDTLRVENLAVEFNCKKNDFEIDENTDWNYYSKSYKYPKVQHYLTIYFKNSLEEIHEIINLITADNIFIIPTSIKRNLIKGVELKQSRGYSYKFANDLFLAYTKQKNEIYTFHHKNLKQAFSKLAKKIRIDSVDLRKLNFKNIFNNRKKLVKKQDSFAIGNCKYGTENFIKKYNLKNQETVRKLYFLYKKNQNIDLLKTINYSIT